MNMRCKSEHGFQTKQASTVDENSVTFEKPPSGMLGKSCAAHLLRILALQQMSSVSFLETSAEQFSCQDKNTAGIEVASRSVRFRWV